MRIIGGEFKGRTLYGFKGEDIRPTSDNARESLFNILGDIKGADFLDLFSGTGAVGIEAISRGANVVFNDRSRESVALTKENLKKVGAQGEVCSFDALAFIGSTRKRFDIAFLDPPYNSETAREFLGAVSKILKDGGVVVFEDEKPFTGVADGLVLTDVRRYGRAILHFFVKKGAGAAVYAGSFDPITVGHERSVLAAIDAFGKAFVVVGENAGKTPFFTEGERTDMVKAALNGANAEVLRFSDFNGEEDYAEFLEKNGARYYVRGIRDEDDFRYEKKAERKNAEVYPFITTAYIFCEDEFKGVSSTKVKKLIEKGKSATDYIPSGARALFSGFIAKKQPK
ncbi:MAG: 16S rRNA (guanine(966)-N(2))-methyltransferase RsmD [Clostridia bacterium]|nr:16S rRNA (guanine(966)-N(2))-methyltransferase RsmD [Clostridia bacterium]